MNKTVGPQHFVARPSSEDYPKFMDSESVERSASASVGIIRLQIPTESVSPTTWLFKTPIRAEVFSTTPLQPNLGVEGTPDDLSEIEANDVKQSIKEVSEGSAKTFKNIKAALSWLDEEH